MSLLEETEFNLIESLNDVHYMSFFFLYYFLKKMKDLRMTCHKGDNPNLKGKTIVTSN